MAKHEKFQFKSASDLITKAKELSIDLPWSDSVEPMLQQAVIEGIRVPNRMAVHPMEGYDSKPDGAPGDLAFRRYGRYATGGSGMIWFEACSVTSDGRSNPHQMMITSDNVHRFKKLTDHIRTAAAGEFGPDHRPFLVLQLTHSGRYSNPGGDFMPRIFSDNPYLDEPILAGQIAGQCPIPDVRQPDRPHPLAPAPALALLTGAGERTVKVFGDSLRASGREPVDFYSDHELDEIKAAYVRAIDLAEQAGFDAVDVKACHGYLLHEMLFAYDRTDSSYGGSFDNRTRFLREVLNTPSKIIKSVRLNAFDLIPYPHGFGMKPDGSMEIDLSETKRLIAECSRMVPLWNITAGLPRLATHVGRPYDRGTFNTPPPNEHPLEGIARLMNITGELQQTFPEVHFVGTGYSWLRQFYPNVGAGILGQKRASFIGLGRSSFAYPDLPKDLMLKGKPDPKKVCLSCSKCTELMRLELPTGCAMRDDQYKGSRLRLLK